METGAVARVSLGRAAGGSDGRPRPGLSRDLWARRAYLVTTLGLTAVYPLLPSWGRHVDFVVVSLSAIPAVVVGLLRINPSRRLPWWLLLAALGALNIANVVALLPGGVASAASQVVDAVGNALILAAAITVIVRQGRQNLGSIVDTTIVALALGGLVWGVALAPNLGDAHSRGAALVDVFVAVFALCGVLGALGRLMQIVGARVPALLLLLAALTLDLAGYIVLALSTGPDESVAVVLLYMAAYIAIGLFGLDPSSPRLAAPAPAHRKDTLSIGRLAFLGVAVAAIPVAVGVILMARSDVAGLLLATGAVTIAALVMVRIGNLSADRDRAEAALRHEATHDPLTGLPNRREFILQLGSRLSRGKRCVILYCDLDGFKAINDRLGHEAGDQLLVEVARRLSACVGAGDVVSRFGGDEFLILFWDKGFAEIEAMCRRIVGAMSLPVALGDELVKIGVSMGLAITSDVVDAEELIRRADRAMYQAKRDQPDASSIRIVAA